MANEDNHPKVGKDSVVYGHVQHRNVGDRSVVIGPTDNRGNTILRPAPGGTAIGAGAKAGPYSLSVGAGAGAGAKPALSNDDEEAKPPEVLQMKPTFYGVGIDLKELWRRGQRFLKR
jgi:hypothetical protein